MPTTILFAPRKTAQRPDEDPPGGFADHLEELRRRLGVCLLTLVVTAWAGITQADGLIEWLRRPAGAALQRFAFFSPTEAFVAYVKVGVLAGVALAMPVFLLQLWAFIRPALRPRERTLGLSFVWWGSVCFFAGAAFAYQVLLPASLRFLLGIGGGRLMPLISIDRYVAFVTTVIFWCGVVFELPAVLFVLAKAGIVTSAWLRQQRPYAILVLVILAAVITPTTDVVNLLLMTGPLVVLYEISIWLTHAAIRRRPE
jgi:sec-independent protein translocase protein TatC